MTQRWTDLFEKVKAHSTIGGRPVEAREAQVIFGQAVVDSFDERRPLVAECPVGTGKSLGYLIPVIEAVREPSEKRAVISTETIALQDQIALKDLPFLAGIYDGFTYRLLKGRSNYVCFEHAKYASAGNKKALGVYEAINGRRGHLREGERRDVERVLGYELDDYLWSFVASSSTFCAENQCSPDECFSTRARELALKADIVVVNHSLLQAHAEGLSADNPSAEGILGQVDYLVVDEAHTLEDVLVDGWTETVSEWELTEMHSSVSKGLDKSTRLVDAGPTFFYTVEKTLDELHQSLKDIQTFYELLNTDQEWRNVSTALCEKTVYGNSDRKLIGAMETVEGPVLQRLARAQTVLAQVQKHLQRAIAVAIDQQVKGRRDLKKGLTAAGKLRGMCEMIEKALGTKNGIVMRFGLPCGVIVDGFVRRSGENGVRIRIVPIDVSKKAEVLWSNSTSILVSATLSDLTDGSFDYLTTSLGFPAEYEEIKTGSPFDYLQQQLIYITPGQQAIVDVPGARYSFDELVELMDAAQGRSLSLFTARGELDNCADSLLQKQAAGDFVHPVLIQHKDSNKQKLVEQFKSMNSSVLLATKSFFTGVDFPGDTCSLVVICKFPLPRFDVVCRQRMDWWRQRGFSKWYEREALTVFQQAAGRLIRTGSDRGVIAVIDQRVTNPGERVYQTARIGVDALGSRVTRSVEDVRRFLS